MNHFSAVPNQVNVNYSFRITATPSAIFSPCWNSRPTYLAGKQKVVGMG